MGKIGIITFHASHNCGSMLQAFALQQTIEKICKCQTEIINFSNEAQKEYYAIFSKVKNIKKLIKNFLFLLSYKLIKRHFDDYNSFMHIYLKLTIKSYASNEELKKEKFNYSTIIAGSDQCWNILCEDGDDSYFINFVDGCNINKVAYAPSLGSTNIKKNTKDLNKYVNYLNQFNVLSVREKNAKIWLEDLTGKHVELLVDPTLLFDKRQWLKMFNIEKKEHTNFIFYYAFKYDPEVNIIVKKIAKKYKKDIYIIDAKAWVRNALWRNGFKISQSGGPLEFLKMMYSADMVLTTSFHGTAFSAIFHKNFWFLNSNMHSPDDDRATSLLRQIGLEHRFLDIKNIKKTDLLENIDYSVVDQRIKHEQYKSFDYLKKFVY